MSDLGFIIGFARQTQAEQDQMTEKWKVRIRKEWGESKKMPRKMKKRVRKSLLLDWQFANYDPFDGIRI